MINQNKIWYRDEPLLQADFLVREKIPEYLENLEEKLVLDAGCGDGYLTRRLAHRGARVEAFDISEAMIKIAKQNNSNELNNIAYTVGDILHVEELYPLHYFDVVIASCVLCAFDKQKMYHAVASLAGMIKENGKIIIASNNLEVYTRKAKSPWIHFTSEPISDEESQHVAIEFMGHDGKKFFKEECYFHSKQLITDAIEKAGLTGIKVIQTLASERDTSHFAKMWGNETSIPYHFIFIAEKNTKDQE